MKENLLLNKLVDGDGTAITWSGGGADFTLTGTLGGATASVSIDIGGGYATNTELTMSALGVYGPLFLPTGALVKATVASATGTTDLTLIIISL